MLEKLKKVKGAEWVLLLVALAAVFFFMSRENPKAADFSSSAEQRLARVLSQIDGAGQVEVFIYTGEPTETVYAFSGASSQQMQITGVLIVAEGADSTHVRLRLAEAARTALGVDASKVSVYTKKQSKEHG